ncbi:Helicase conserved C-terminal domain-containing protein [Paenibacillus tianmuensis]|uniref:Helicase conserved C-terminal domain-containing protein n=1 Tax=Paenibacillus tianmuensis TaxID=624147 RepID=A0A1G4Q549_9BACL|nr:helicase-associated domain-containing protein [Paenibacillus tianmuensis]SCW39555.1 Helicase conserved C-terminal domain-containing protein [Paenibacillus tianmuensis]
MNYAQLLMRMPRELKSQLEAETIYAPWLGQGASLCQIWTDPVVMETVCNRLSRSERTVLEAVVRRISSEPFDDAELERAAVGPLSGAEVKMGLAGLLRKGIVFSFLKTWGEPLYLMPEDGFACWQSVLFPEMSSGLGESPGSAGLSPAPALPAEPNLARDLFYTMVLAAEQGLKLTKNGTLHKKQLQKLSERVRLREEALEPLSLKYAYADTYSPKIALVLDMLLRLQLVVSEDEELKLGVEAVDAFLDKPLAAQMRRLYSLWKTLALPAAAWQQHAVCLLERVTDGTWITAEQLLERLETFGLLPGTLECGERAERTRYLLRLWLEPLAALGFLEQGSDPIGGPVTYRWTFPLGLRDELAGEDEAEDGGLMVQPDFELLVPPDVAGKVRWELCCLADLVARDQVSVYKLSKESVKRALENGRTAAEICDFLERHALYGVPDHVRLSIGQWAKPYGKTVFTQALLLRCADDETARTVAKLPAASPYVKEMLNGRDFLIAAADAKPLAVALEKAGFMPGLPAFPAAQTETDGEMRASRFPKLSAEQTVSVKKLHTVEPLDKGLIYSRNSVGFLRLQTRLPETSDVYPSLQDIPPTWLRDYRNYHVSTRKEIVEKAIEMRSVLQIRKNGADFRIVPRKVQETRGTWCMTGLGLSGGAQDETSEVRWLAEEWQEMRLILPGINDKY